MHQRAGQGWNLACVLLMLAALCFVPADSIGQEIPPTPPTAGQTPQSQTSLLRVFIDCQFECDTEYLRQTVEFVDYVRDRAVAEVHLLVTTQETGGGGRAWTLKFIGLGRFQGQERTLTFNTATTASGDDRRREFARVFRLGIAGYAAESSAGPQLDVTWQRPATQAQATPAKDPWNFWVFRASGNGNLDGEQRSKSHSFRVSMSASRTTAEWKMNFSASRDTSRSTFDLDDGERVVSRRNSWNMNTLIVRSLGPKWSFGIRSGASHSSFSNTDMSFNAGPGIEFDFFPYSESSRRSLTIRYDVGGAHYDYRDLTVFDKMTDTVPSHSVTVALGLRQPWGSVGLQSFFNQHLNKRGRYRTGVFGDADVRLFKGFSFNMFANYDKIADQIGLPKGSASTEEVLLRLRQLETSYSYFMGFGLSYSFGSIFNSVVNPRFGG